MRRTTMSVIAVLAAAGATAGIVIADPQGSAAASRACGQVSVSLPPEGEGGGIDIRARNIGCSKARGIVRRCIRGTVARGWHASFGTTRLVLESGNRRIGYTPVGGGGCVDL